LPSISKGKKIKNIYSERNVVRKNRGNSLLSYIPDQRGDDRGPNLLRDRTMFNRLKRKKNRHSKDGKEIALALI